ncbi:MAG: mobilization protein [Mucilaginibacter sp.]|uniref:mobilization protein n=1 Tax=Mucilaginibacter sp. TaxID=1882438 RepID=UPI003265323A
MPRKKYANPEAVLTHFVRTRLTKAAFNRLDKIRQSSDCHSVGEVARKLLSQEKITLFYKDMTLNSAMEELALIRKELKAIGININQLTRGYHIANKKGQSTDSHLLQVAKLYQSVDKRTDEILRIINQLSQKWLPK